MQTEAAEDAEVAEAETEAGPEPKEAVVKEAKEAETRVRNPEVLDTPPHHQSLVVNAIMSMELTRGTAWSHFHALGRIVAKPAIENSTNLTERKI